MHQYMFVAHAELLAAVTLSLSGGTLVIGFNGSPHLVHTHVLHVSYTLRLDKSYTINVPVHMVGMGTMVQVKNWNKLPK